MRLILARLGSAALLVVGVSMLTFLIIDLTPGEYFDEMRIDSSISPETIETLRARYGLDQPLPLRYGRWLASVGQGEWGYSFSHNRPVAPLLWERAKNTLLLTLSATVVGWIAALAAGAWAATSRSRWTRTAFALGTSTLLAIPELVLALALLMLAVDSGWFPAGGMASVDAAGLGWRARLLDLGHHLALPVTVLAAGIFPVLARHVHASLSQVLASPLIEAVRGLGLSRRRVLFGYAFPVASNPLISLAGFSIGALLSGSLLVEVVMSWPGMGPLMLEAIFARDVHLVLAAVILSTLLLIAGNLLADLVLLAIDPRVREV